MSLLFNRFLTASSAYASTSSRLAVRIGRNGVASSLTIRLPSTYIPSATFSTSKPPNKTLPSSNDANFIDGRPSLEYAKKSMQLHSFSSMPHEQIIQLSAEGIGGARREALLRNIMAVDEVEYDDAEAVVDNIAQVNRERMFLQALPYHVGFGAAVSAGVLSIPLVFHLGTVEAFNTMFVTADVPEPKDLETWLEVGSWSWAWMEPLIGQASFMLLTMQFARSQLTNMGLKPYSNWMRHRRAQRLVARFPQYNSSLLRQFSEVDKYYNGWNSDK